MGLVNDIKLKLISLYIYIRIKYLSYKYNISTTKIFAAYISLYHHFPTVIMILDRCRNEDKDFDHEVNSAIAAKEMIEELMKNEGDSN